MSKQALQVGIVQFSMEDNPTKNLEKAIVAIEHLADKGAECIVLPELFLTKYFCQKEDIKFFSLAEEVPGKTTKIFEEIAKRRSVSIVLSLFEKVNTGIYFNTVAYISDKGYQGKYRKTHIPDDPSFYEKFYFAPGDLGFNCYSLKSFNLAPLICWDQWFPEAARIAALKGANILVYPTAIGWHPKEKEAYGAKQFTAWETIQRSHAIANGCYVVVANRVGYESIDSSNTGIQFWGQSFAVNPYGEVIAKANDHDDASLLCEINLDLIEEFRHGWPFFRDRRVDLYSDLTKLHLE
jgi:N-carbamoylputrescine amidase